MTQTKHVEDLDDRSFDPVLADDLLFGDIEDPYRILAELRAREIFPQKASRRRSNENRVKSSG